jgi:hypothetical protein
VATGITYTVNFGTLSFDDTSTTYRVLNMGLAKKTTRRSLEFAPDIHGAAETSRALDEGAYVLQVRCVGTSYSNCKALMAALDTAASQRSFTLTTTEGGVTEVWQARAYSDWDAPLDPEKSWSSIREVTVTIPVYPIPT